MCRVIVLVMSFFILLPRRRLSLEMPVSVSNVLLVCEKCDAAARLGARYLDDGSKERYCKKCGAGNGQIAPAKARYAKQ